MKFKEFKHEPVEPDTYEASMALNQLMRIGKHAIKLHNMIDDAAEMESWVAKKIDLAGDYVKKVYNYTEGEKAGLYDDGGMTEERTPQEKLAIMSKIEKIKKQSKDLAGDKDKDLIDKNKKILATLTKMLHEDAGDMDLIGDGAENLGLDPNKFDYYYDTSGAGYGEVRTKSGKAILQFEYDRDGDAEVSTMDNKTIANIKQGEQLPNNVTAKLNMIKEGASFYGYYKDPKDPEGRRMTYPDDMEFKTPHRSNAAARMLLQRIGLDPDFENTESTPIDDFIAATDKYLRMNVSDKDNPEYDEVEVYDQEARRIKKTHPEVTHVGFN
tara:strand:+ start:8334 stop:9311 length:978 start_codon:yes stop_codon:yes gene_type:complete